MCHSLRTDTILMYTQAESCTNEELDTFGVKDIFVVYRILCEDCGLMDCMYIHGETRSTSEKEIMEHKLAVRYMTV